MELDGITFQSGGMKDLRLLPVTTLPTGISEGTLVNHNGEWKRFTGVADTWERSAFTAQFTSLIFKYVEPDQHVSGGNVCDIIELGGCIFILQYVAHLSSSPAHRLTKMTNGVVDWTKRFKVLASASPTSSRLAHDGTNIFIHTDGATASTSATIKVDQNGVLIWHHRFNNPTVSHYYTSGDISYNGTDVIEGGKFVNVNGVNIRRGLLSKIEGTTGAIIWSKYLGNTATNDDKKSENVLAVTTIGSDLYAVTTAFDENGAVRLTLTKFNTNGAVVWSRALKHSDFFRGITVGRLITDGTYLYYAGTTVDSYSKFTGNIIKYDTAGNLIFKKKYRRNITHVYFHDLAIYDGVLYVGGSQKLSTEISEAFLWRISSSTGGVLGTGSLRSLSAPIYKDANFHSVNMDESGNLMLAGNIDTGTREGEAISVCLTAAQRDTLSFWSGTYQGYSLNSSTTVSGAVYNNANSDQLNAVTHSITIADHDYSSSTVYSGDISVETMTTGVYGITLKP